MFARNVSIHLKSNMLADYTQAFQKDVLPLLRKQNGFKDEIIFAGSGGIDVTAISLWENKADAEKYNTNTYPDVLKTLARFVEGTPKVHTFDVVNSTFHKIAAPELVTA
jgi:hypothetical protein